MTAPAKPNPNYPPTVDVDADDRQKRSDDQPAENNHSDEGRQEDGDSKNSGAEEGHKDPQTQKKPVKPFYKRPILMGIVVCVCLVLLAGGIGYWLHARQFEWTDDAFVDGHSVRLSPKVAGYVTQLNIVDNQFVQQGDRLLEIDRRDYEIALAAANDAQDSARGQLAQAVAKVEANVAQLAEAQSDVKAAEATALNAKQEKERNEKLVPRAASQEVLDASLAKERMTQAQLEASLARVAAARQQVNLAKSQVVTAKAQVAQAQVQVQQAELNLSYTKIDAPISGYVTRRSVEQGDYLQPGAALMALVSPNFWVTANFKETQLTLMQPGQNVDIRIDSYPDHRFRGHIDSIQRGSGARFSVLPAENATGNYVKVVQRVPVKIVIDDPIPDRLAIGLGMSVIPTVRVRGEAKDRAVTNRQSPLKSTSGQVRHSNPGGQ